MQGKVFPAPVKVVLSDFTRFEPDVVFVSEKNVPILKRDGIYGAPDLAIEVYRQIYSGDRNIKLSAYLEFGVKDVWLVDPEQNCIEIYTAKREPFCILNEREQAVLTSPTVPGLVLTMKELVRDLRGSVLPEGFLRPN